MANIDKLLDEILDDARWAPSGHNMQPWRFEKISPEEFNIHSLYDRDVFNLCSNNTNLLCVGMMLEIIRLSAAQKGRSVEWSIRTMDENTPVINVRLGVSPVQVLETDWNLFEQIRTRSVNRNSYQWVSLTEEDRQLLQGALGNGLQIHWYETFFQRLTLANLARKSTDIRLRLKEAYPIHKRMVDWSNKDSTDKIPVRSLGLDPLTCFMMKIVVKDWKYQKFLNALPGGLMLYQLEADIWAGISSAAHFMISSSRPLPTDGTEKLNRILSVGMGIQRFWLMASLRGLVIHPNHILLILSEYARKAVAFTGDQKEIIKAKKLGQDFDQLTGSLPISSPDQILFMGRIGYPRAKKTSPRSVRLPVDDLMVDACPGHSNCSGYFFKSRQVK